MGTILCHNNDSIPSSWSLEQIYWLFWKAEQKKAEEMCAWFSMLLSKGFAVEGWKEYQAELKLRWSLTVLNGTN